MKDINFTIVGEQPAMNQKSVHAYLNPSNIVITTGAIAIEVNELELICLNYKDRGSDLMFGYNRREGRNTGTLYLGKWNP
jgi:hypothetical protein